MGKIKEIIDDEGIRRKVNYTGTARYRHIGVNYYFDCGKCKNQVIGDDSGCVYDCNNARLTEDNNDYNIIDGKYYLKDKNNKAKVYCLNYIGEK